MRWGLGRRSNSGRNLTGSNRKIGSLGSLRNKLGKESDRSSPHNDDSVTASITSRVDEEDNVAEVRRSSFRRVKSSSAIMEPLGEHAREDDSFTDVATVQTEIVVPTQVKPSTMKPKRRSSFGGTAVSSSKSKNSTDAAVAETTTVPSSSADSVASGLVSLPADPTQKAVKTRRSRTRSRTSSSASASVAAAAAASVMNNSQKPASKESPAPSSPSGKVKEMVQKLEVKGSSASVTSAQVVAAEPVKPQQKTVTISDEATVASTDNFGDTPITTVTISTDKEKRRSKKMKKLRVKRSARKQDIFDSGASVATAVTGITNYDQETVVTEVSAPVVEVSKASKKSKSKKKGPRSVSFVTDPEGKIEPSVHSFENENFPELWWCDEELVETLRDCMRIVTKLRGSAGKEYIKSVNRLHHSYKKAVSEAQTTKSLQVVANFGIARGLEIHVIPKLRSMREGQVSKLMELQEGYKKKTGAMTLNDEIMELLRKEAMKSSRPCRQFAFMVAQYDTHESLKTILDECGSEESPSHQPPTEPEEEIAEA